jgi:hypothetical protein
VFDPLKSVQVLLLPVILKYFRICFDTLNAVSSSSSKERRREERKSEGLALESLKKQ